MLWIFDLDNTLHHASKCIFPQINKNMNAYIAQHVLGNGDIHTANRLRAQFWREFGATLLGIAQVKNDQSRQFLHDAHVFEHLEQMLFHENHLRQWMNSIVGRKVILTNAPHDYALRIVKLLGVEGCFEKIFAIDTVNLFGHFAPKPSSRVFKKLARQCHVMLSQCILVDDDSRVLKVAKSLNMKTIWFVRYRKKDVHQHSTPFSVRHNDCENLSYVDYRVNSMRQLSRIAKKIV